MCEYRKGEEGERKQRRSWPGPGLIDPDGKVQNRMFIVVL